MTPAIVTLHDPERVRSILRFRRGPDKAIAKYPAEEGELILSTDSWRPYVFLNSFWVPVPGHLLFKWFMDGYARNIRDRFVFKPYAYAPCVMPARVDSDHVNDYIFGDGEIVCNTTTETVHVGDGCTIGGVIID